MTAAKCLAGLCCSSGLVVILVEDQAVLCLVVDDNTPEQNSIAVTAMHNRPALGSMAVSMLNLG